MAEDLEQRLREAEARLRENLRSFDLEVEFQLSNEGERADLWTDIDVNIDDLRTLLDALSTSRARVEALEKALRASRSALDGLFEGHLSSTKTGLSAWDGIDGFDVCKAIDAALSRQEEDNG